MGWLTDILGVDIRSAWAAVSRRRAINFGRSLLVADDPANDLVTISARFPGIGPTAWVKFHVTSNVAVVDAHKESWDPGGTTPPTIARNSSGDFTITWPRTILDEGGEAVFLEIAVVTVHPSTSVSAVPIGSMTNSYTAHVVTGTDATLFVAAWAA
jgi:hypothetical protein